MHVGGTWPHDKTFHPRKRQLRPFMASIGVKVHELPDCLFPHCDYQVPPQMWQDRWKWEYNGQLGPRDGGGAGKGKGFNKGCKDGKAKGYAKTIRLNDKGFNKGCAPPPGGKGNGKLDGGDPGFDSKGKGHGQFNVVLCDDRRRSRSRSPEPARQHSFPHSIGSMDHASKLVFNTSY